MKKLFKKAMITMCSAVMLMGISAVGANAATVEVGDFTIDRSYSSGSYTTKVKSYNGKGGDIILPTEAEFAGTKYTITEVGDAFKDNDMITGVTIPEGYTDIGMSCLKCSHTSQTVPVRNSVPHSTCVGANLNKHQFSPCYVLLFFRPDFYRILRPFPLRIKFSLYTRIHL